MPAVDHCCFIVCFYGSCGRTDPVSGGNGGAERKVQGSQVKGEKVIVGPGVISWIQGKSSPGSEHRRAGCKAEFTRVIAILEEICPGRIDGCMGVGTHHLVAMHSAIHRYGLNNRVVALRVHRHPVMINMLHAGTTVEEGYCECLSAKESEHQGAENFGPEFAHTGYGKLPNRASHPL